MLHALPCRLTASRSTRRALIAVALSIAGASALLPGTAFAATQTIPSKAKVTSVHASTRVVQGRPAAMTAAAAAASARVLHSSTTAAVASTSCWTWTPWVSGKDIFGLTVWRYNQGLYWCGNGSWITYRAGANDYPSNTALGWGFKGNLGYWNAGGTGHYSWEHWNQGHFCLVSYFDCVQNSYPAINSTVNARGGGSFTYSG